MIKDVGYPLGLTIDTATGLISGRPLPEAVFVDLTGLTLDHTYAAVPDWSPTTLTLHYLGYGLVYPGYHQWEYRVDNGNDVRACILTFNPTTGDTSVQALTKPSSVEAASWYSWSRTNLNPFGVYTTPFTTSGVIGSSVAPATVSAVPAHFASLDATRWVGAWDMEAPGEPNRVTGAPGSTFTLSGFTGYTLATKVAGGPLTSSQCISLPSGASSYERGASMTAVTLTAFTMAAWLKGDAAGHAPGLRIFQAVNNSTGTVQFAVGINNLAIGGVSYPVTVEPADANWHHYAVTWNGTTGATKVYVDGVEVWSGTTLVGSVTCGWCGFDSATAELNGFGDQFVLHRDVLPVAAIERLAEGLMPDSTGHLPGAPLAVDITATNAEGSDVETLMLTADAGGNLGSLTPLAIIAVVASGTSRSYLPGAGWVNMTLPAPNLRDVVWSGSNWFATRESDLRVFKSPDGTHWTDTGYSSVSPGAVHANAQCAINAEPREVVAAVQWPNTLHVSLDGGSTWTSSQPAGSNGYLNDVYVDSVSNRVYVCGQIGAGAGSGFIGSAPLVDPGALTWALSTGHYTTVYSITRGPHGMIVATTANTNQACVRVATSLDFTTYSEFTGGTGAVTAWGRSITWSPDLGYLLSAHGAGILTFNDPSDNFTLAWSYTGGALDGLDAFMDGAEVHAVASAYSAAQTWEWLPNPGVQVAGQGQHLCARRAPYNQAPNALYRYWRIEITGASVGGSFGGLVINEIEGYETADGSGTNVFRNTQGTVCTSTGGYSGTPGYTGDGTASVAIDGNTADSASSTYTALGTVIGQYFQFDCGVPRDIKLSKIFYTTGTQQVGVKLRASTDGTTWVNRSAQVNVGVGGRPTLLPAI